MFLPLCVARQWISNYVSPCYLTSQSSILADCCLPGRLLKPSQVLLTIFELAIDKLKKEGPLQARFGLTFRITLGNLPCADCFTKDQLLMFSPPSAIPGYHSCMVRLRFEIDLADLSTLLDVRFYQEYFSSDCKLFYAK